MSKIQLAHHDEIEAGMREMDGEVENPQPGVKYWMPFCDSHSGPSPLIRTNDKVAMWHSRRGAELAVVEHIQYLLDRVSDPEDGYDLRLFTADVDELYILSVTLNGKGYIEDEDGDLVAEDEDWFPV